MSALRPIYHCSHCKKIMKNVEQLLFVEEGSQRGFCSEPCIEKYFSPIIDHFEEWEKNYRKKSGINDEPCMKYVGHPSFMEMTLTKPAQIWRAENDLKEELFVFIGDFKERETQFQKNFYLIIVCTVFDHKPAFIFSVTATKDKELLKSYQIGERILEPQKFLKATTETDESPDGPDVLPEGVQSLELKKSHILAQQLELRSEADIPFDQFNLYDQFFDQTVEDPDEVYRWQDDLGDTLLTYIKAHNQGNTSFFYFVIMHRIDPKYVVFDEKDKLANKAQEVLVPVLSFPTVDGEMSAFYRKGDLLSSVTKN
jgi:hypothetical protein